MASNKYKIYQNIQTEAMAEILNQSDVYFFRKVCRWYSEKFHTSLHTVIEGKAIQWDEVLMHYYQCQMEDIGYNNIYELACQEYIPELAEKFEKDNEEFARALEEEQAKTIKANKHKIEKRLAKTQKKLDDMGKIQPKSMNLSFDDNDHEGDL